MVRSLNSELRTHLGISKKISIESKCALFRKLADPLHFTSELMQEVWISIIIVRPQPIYGHMYLYPASGGTNPLPTSPPQLASRTSAPGELHLLPHVTISQPALFVFDCCVMGLGAVYWASRRLQKKSD